ncbi:MAG: threonine ammonia-lyase [Euryarchaeota archaeon]|nr:threonine ammonia-lyase [Euryarchaeota archaeon]
MNPVSLKDIEVAEGRIRKVVHHTPLTRSATLSKITGAEFYLKLENQQRTGSFKIRGAFNKLQSMSEAERKRGVVAASAGNHAQGVALAATMSGAKSTIFMPRDATVAKAEATRNYGADVVLTGKDYAEAFEASQRFAAETGAVVVHAFDDPAIIAGQGTIGLEILRDNPDIDTLICGVGGGGLISGVATTMKSMKPGMRVIGVQPEGSTTLAESLKKGAIIERASVNTIADGLGARKVGKIPFEIMRELVDEAPIVSDQEISYAILMLLERAKVVAEGAAAAGLAACLSGKVDVKGRKVACIVSGGNIDINLLDQIINMGLIMEGRIFRFSVIIPDKPGSLRQLIAVIAEERANIRTVNHDRHRAGITITDAEVSFELETRGADHIERLADRLKKEGYEIRIRN